MYSEPPDLVDASLGHWKEVSYPDLRILVADDSPVPLRLRPREGVRIIHRSDRAGFKGGALRNAMQYLDPETEWLVVCDADCIVNPDFLERMAVHFGDRVGAVQGYQQMDRNKRQSLLTRYVGFAGYVANAILAGRYRRGGFVASQGTVMAYNVRAIHSIGGLAPYLTVNEDLDTSFRLRMAGWRIIYDPSLAGSHLAAENYRIFFRQQHRWTSSTIREFRRHLPRFLMTHTVPLKERLDSVLFFMTWMVALVVSPTLLFVPFLGALWWQLPPGVSVIITAFPIAFAMIGATAIGRPRQSLLLVLGYFLLLLPGFFVNFHAALSGLVRDGTFHRTEKHSS